jgi:hypothetical protein
MAQGVNQSDDILRRTVPEAGRRGKMAGLNKGLRHRKAMAARKPKLGSGARFKKLKGKLSKRGASNPGALAAYIGRKKYGKKKFAKLSAKGRKK